MVALLDCNNFFVSCELTVRPELRGKPVVVGGRGDNGGCVVALSDEAKALGIPRGIPIFKIRSLIERKGVVVLPGNHKLYAEISARVMNAVASLDVPVEIYSIDEAFIRISFDGADAEDFCRYVRQYILDRTGIPVGIGISTTKTLAKIAARFAKRYAGYKGVCLMETPEKIAQGLRLTAAGDVWGIGRRLKAKLDRIGIATAAQFAALSLEQVERSFTAPVVATWRELHGEYMLDEDTHRRRHQSCTCSRTFDRDIHERAEIERRIAGYATAVARSLRKHHRLATEIEVFLATNPYKPQLPQRTASARVKLDEPTADTLVIASASKQAFEQVYRRGYAYKRGGVSATHAIDERTRPVTLFTDVAARQRSDRLMSVIDRLNASGLPVNIAGAVAKEPES